MSDHIRRRIGAELERFKITVEKFKFPRFVMEEANFDKKMKFIEWKRKSHDKIKSKQLRNL